MRRHFGFLMVTPALNPGVTDRDKNLDFIGLIVAALLIFSLATVAFTILDTSSRHEAAPNADWSLQQINDTHARVTHAGGEPADARNLTVVLNEDEEIHVAWSTSPLREGSHGDLEAGSGDVVRLYWRGGRTRGVLLESWRVNTTTNQSTGGAEY